MALADQLQAFNSDLSALLSSLRGTPPATTTLPNNIASGDTTQTSTVLWSRSSAGEFVGFEVATDPNFTNIVTTIAAETTDATVPIKVEVTDLTPGTTYYYRATDSVGSSAIGKFDTAAATGNFDGLRFGVAGDWRGELSPYPAITNADDRDLDFFVLHGDTIYADFPSPALPKAQAETLAEFRLKHDEVYSDRSGLNAWGDLRASTSIFANIDDHEVTNDFSGGASPTTDDRFANTVDFINDTPLYENGLQAFQEYNPIRDDFYGETGDDRTANERKLYRFNTFGSDAATFVLDARSFRDPELPAVTDTTNTTEIFQFLASSFDPTRTMLGQAQLDDLKQDLLAADASGITWKFVMVPEPIQNLGVLAAGDRFEGYAAERTEILSFIDANDIDNVVFIAADVHGTMVNNLTYQTAPGGEQIPINGFEITTGSVAFEEPFGPTVVDLAAAVGLLPAEQVAFYDSLPQAAQDGFIEALINEQIVPLGYDPVGLDNNLPGINVDATLLQGGYVATQTYGWTEFEIDPTTQELLVTTYGIEDYTEAELNADPSAIVARTPEIVSQFSVSPEFDTPRFASFNASLNRNSEGELITNLSTADDEQAQAVAEIIQRNNPDVLLVNEFDYDASGTAAQLFQDNYLSVSQNGADPVTYPYRIALPSNTGIASGFDLDNNGIAVTTIGEDGYGNDAFGFGNFPGQFGFVVYSKYPILEDKVRTFQNFLWKDMPDALLPDDPNTAEPNDFYSAEELEVLRLSSKNHADIPIEIQGKVVNLLASHPTPPVFDGDEDRNGRRNHDEIRFWSDYITPSSSDYIVDDAGVSGGLAADTNFVIAGDLNADLFDGDSTNRAALQLTDNPLINHSIIPSSQGGVDASDRQGGNNLNQQGDPAFDTADFGEAQFGGPGNLRVDYVLPSQNLGIVNAGVFWPEADGEFFDLVGDFPFPASDHRLVFADLNLSPVPTEDASPVVDHSRDRRTVNSVELLGEVTFPTGLDFNGTVVGGLSGIAYDASNGVYYSLSDDRSQNNPARYYTLTIDLSDGQLNDGDINFTGVTTLLDAAGQPFVELSLDPEGIALSSSGSLFIASEGDTNNLINPFVNEFTLDGQQVSTLPVDSKFLPTADNSTGIRNNAAFESLTLTPDQEFLFTATENALNQDGSAATLENGTLSRIVQYDMTNRQAVAEFVYPTEPIVEIPEPADGFSTNGLVELLALDNNGTFLALERSFSSGKGNAVKLYEVRSQGALNVIDQSDLFFEAEDTAFEIDPAVTKELLVDFEADFGIEPDNLEGITLGAVLPNGRQSLIVVSDNNFNNTQVTQFIGLGLDLGTVPTAFPQLETAGFADLETATLPGDADDPAIWVNPTDASQSVVLGTLKDGGLVSFNLEGEILQTIAPATFGEQRYNNVDLVYGFDLNGQSVDLAVASDRANDTLAIWQIDSTTGQLTNVTSANIPATIFGVDDGEATAYGLGTYTSPIDGQDYAFVTQAGGNLVAQLELLDDGSGGVTANIIRILELPVPTGDVSDSQAEGVVADREAGVVYIVGEEAYGLLKFDAEPTGGTTITEVHPIDSEFFQPDIEGLTIYYGAGGAGYLLASSQGDSTYTVFDRQGDNAYLGSFAIGDLGGIDQVNETDGAEVINVALGTEFPNGLFVVQDGANDPQVVVADEEELENTSTNFKFVPWENVANAFATRLAIDTTSSNPRTETAVLSSSPSTTRRRAQTTTDSLTGAEVTTVVFDAPIGGGDVLTDFSAGDRIQLSAADFDTLTDGVNFISSVEPVPTDAQATVLYDTESGVLSFDRDGIGDAPSQNLAFLLGTPQLEATQVSLI